MASSPVSRPSGGGSGGSPTSPPKGPATATNNKTSSRRREMDFAKMASEERFIVHTIDDSVHEFWIELSGPKDTPYVGGLWTLHVTLPAEYPFRSPSIGFANRIYHPNVDEASGSVCLDVINQTWTPVYELANVFDTFLPQLLRYPNSADPLNPEAAALQLRDPVAYASKVQEHVRANGSVEACRQGLLRSGVTEISPRSCMYDLHMQATAAAAASSNGSSHSNGSSSTHNGGSNGTALHEQQEQDYDEQQQQQQYQQPPAEEDNYEPDDIDI